MDQKEYIDKLAWILIKERRILSTRSKDKAVSSPVDKIIFDYFKEKDLID